MKVKNWMKIREAEIQFPESGVVLVLGKNMTNSGKFESIGAGKTSVGEALCCALTGVTGRYANVRDCSTGGNGDMLVSVTGTLADKPFTVDLGYKYDGLSETGEGLRFTYDGNTIQRNHIRATRQEIASAIGITPQLSKWTVYVDGDDLDFDEMSHRGSVDLLMEALNQPPWTQFHEHSKKSMASFKRDLEEATRDHADAKEAVSTLKEELDDAKRDLRRLTESQKTAADERKVKVEAVKAEITKLEGELKTMRDTQRTTQKRIEEITRDNADSYKKFELERKRVQSMEARAHRFKDRRLEKKTQLKTALDDAEDDLRALTGEPESCPKCGKAWDKKHSKQEISDAKEKVKVAEARYQKMRDLYQDATADIAEYGRRLDKINDNVGAVKAEKKISELSQAYEDRQDDIERTVGSITVGREELAELSDDPMATKVQEAKAVVTEREKNLRRAESKVTKATSEMVEIREALKVVDYWNTAFSPGGIPNMVLRDSIAPLNSVSKRISSLMTGGAIQVSYSTNRELASGKEKTELVIKTSNTSGAHKLEGNSKGELGLTNLIISETLSEVGRVSNRVGFRWYDEVVNSQDPLVRQNIFSYMRDLARKHGILVFVVDHSPEASNFCDHILVVEKRDSGTEIYWE